MFFMARVVLVWNEHPNEVVAGFHARKVAEILRRKYRHEVTLVKLPFSRSEYAVLRGKTPLQHRLVQLARYDSSSSYAIAKDLAKKHGVPVFNFHSTPAENMAQANKRKPRSFRLSRRNFVNKILGELLVYGLGKNGFIVEVPAHFQSLPARLIELTTRRKLRRAIRAVEKRLSRVELKVLVEALRPLYYTMVPPLQQHRQKKFLSPVISRKLAEEIHARLLQ